MFLRICSHWPIGVIKLKLAEAQQPATDPCPLPYEES